jgi:SAM-dependent methyltransferase
VEDAFLSALSQGESAAEILAREQSWPALYHFSDVRRNLLEWFPFEPASRVLEIGAGCGALTGLLCERAREVTALELSRKRAEIIRMRYEGQPNLTLTVGNVRELPLGEPFDVITLVGVLEYAPSFTPGPDPAAALLDIVAPHIGPRGALVVAIENRFGLKYWAGAPEDHTGVPFDGLEGYARHAWVRTFSRPALEDLLRRAGFPFVHFFYPTPDYKLPEDIYSDARPAGPGDIARAFPSWDNERLRVFDECAVLDGIAASGAFPFFANSFLVVARRQSRSEDRGIAPEDVILARYSRSRLPQYRIETRILETGEGTVVQKRALEPAAADHVAAVVAHHQALQPLAGPLRVPPATLRGGVAEVPYVPGTSLESELLDALLTRDAERTRGAVDVFVRLVHALSATCHGVAAFGDDGIGGPVLLSGILDINLDNLIKDASGLWWLIDVEWRRPEPVAADFVISRGLEHIVWKRHDLIAGLLEPQELFDRAGIDPGRRRVFQAQEKSFQRLVRGEQPTFAVDPGFERPSQTLASVQQERRELADALASERAARSKLEAVLAQSNEEARAASPRTEE